MDSDSVENIAFILFIRSHSIRGRKFYFSAPLYFELPFFLTKATNALVTFSIILNWIPGRMY